MSTTPEPGRPARPRQVTLAASLVMAASVMLVVSVFERLANLRSLDSRTAIEDFLSRPPGSDLGLGLESTLSLLRTASMVAAGLATAAAILGWHVLKRNRGARVALSVLALPLFVTGLVTSGFLASVVAASVAMLWLAPSRQWFDGTWTGRPERGPAGDGVGRRDAAQWQQSQQSQAGAPPPPPVQAGPPLPGPPPHAGGFNPYAGPPPWMGPPVPGPPVARRPGSVVAACVITWACCAFAALLCLLLLGVLAADADGLIAEMHRQNPDLADQGVSEATMRSAMWVTAGVLLAWAVVSSALGVLAFRRRRWAAIGLLVSTAVITLVCLAGSLVSPPLVVPGLLAALTVGFILQPSAQRWLSGRP